MSCILSSVEISNFRCHLSTEAPLARMCAIVGRNNAGKSTLMRALRWAIDGGALSSRDCYDSTQPVAVTMHFEGLAESDLGRIVDEEQRRRIRELVEAGRLSLRRTWRVGDRTPVLEVATRKARDARLHPETIGELLKGKSGAKLSTALEQHLPEHAEILAGATTQADAKRRIDAIVSSLTGDAVETEFRPLPTGLPTSIGGMLPEVVLIEAVKDAKDEVKPDGRSTFGRIVGLLMARIETSPQMQKIRDSLDELNMMLNVGPMVDGDRTDGRLGEVKLLERLVGGFLMEGFPVKSVDLEVPSPELKQLFSTARIIIDDGVRGEVETKGDGLKRAVIFALLRTYVEFGRQTAERDDAKREGENAARPYLFLFEEPELYLHPTAQLQLVDTLRALSGDHQVVMTTHSPLFLHPDSVGGFMRLYKVNGEGGKPPKAALKCIDLTQNLTMKDIFQLVHFENNSAGFFAEHVLLVEGDSDVIFFEHLGRILRGRWDLRARGIPVVAMGSKSGLGRFRELFDAFGVTTHAVLDLDAVMEGVDALNAIPDFAKARARLLEELEEVAVEVDAQAKITGEKVRNWTGRQTWKDRYSRVGGLLRAQADEARPPTRQEIEEYESLFEEEAGDRRRQVLGRYPERVTTLGPVLAAARASGVHILARGSVEAYYPPGAEGRDKPSKALSAARLVVDERDLAKVFPVPPDGADGELEHAVIFRMVCGERA